MKGDPADVLASCGPVRLQVKPANSIAQCNLPLVGTVVVDTLLQHTPAAVSFSSAVSTLCCCMLEHPLLFSGASMLIAACEMLLVCYCWGILAASLPVQNCCFCPPKRCLWLDFHTVC